MIMLSYVRRLVFDNITKRVPSLLVKIPMLESMNKTKCNYCKKKNKNKKRADVMFFIAGGPGEYTLGVCCLITLQLLFMKNSAKFEQ